MPAIMRTVHMDHIKYHYFTSHAHLNAFRYSALLSFSFEVFYCHILTTINIIYFIFIVIIIILIFLFLFLFSIVLFLLDLIRYLIFCCPMIETEFTRFPLSHISTERNFDFIFLKKIFVLEITNICHE